MKKKQTIKRQNVINPLRNLTHKVVLPSIIQKESNDAFGIILYTRKSIEQFQINSGMSGNYTKEYQMHIWAANARLFIDEQLLDISIPLVMFNYKQTISGGDIKFSLIDVNEASKSHEALALAKFEELKETKIYKYITEELGITTWNIIPLNTLHCHP